MSSSCLLLWPWLRSLSHGGPCSLHVVLGLAWLPLPTVTGFFEIAQSFQHRTVKKTKKTEKKTKMNMNKQQRKTLGDKQYSPCFLLKTSPSPKNTAYAFFKGLGVCGLGVWVFRCLVFGCSLGVHVFMTFRKIKRVTKEGGPKMAKIFGWGKISRSNS